MAKDTQIAIRITTAKRDRLRAIAEADGRTMAGMIDRAIDRLIREADALNTPPPTRPRGKTRE